MNAKRVFESLKNRGITEAEYRTGSSSSFSIEILNGKLKNYSSNLSSSVTYDAKINNKLAVINTENLTNKNLNQMNDYLFDIAKYTNKEGAFVFKGGTKYKKFNYYNKDLINISNQDKIDMLFKLEKKIRDFDPRIDKVEIGYEETLRKYEYQNTYGVKLKSKSCGFNISAQIVSKDGKDLRSYYHTFVDNDFSKINLDEYTKDSSTAAIEKLNPITVKTGKYDVVFSPEVVNILLEAYASQLNAELVLKNLSWFKDKINTQVANKKITIFETPLKRDRFFTNADDQGVPTRNMTLIKKGVLLTYLHNLDTAYKFNVESNGHASLNGSKMGISAHAALYLKPGRLTKEEILKKVNNGVYINDLDGLHAGMNPQNGNFSLKCEGLLIENGKLTKALSMISITSNLFDIFNNVKLISKNIEYIKHGVFAPCMYLKKVAISS